MKKLLIVFVILATLTSCGGFSGGELVGVQGRRSMPESPPFGMVFIPMGSYNMGSNDQDVSQSFYSNTKTVSVDAFWMDDTEITNNEYRQFVYWVKDSIMRKALGVINEDYLITEDEFGNEVSPPRINYEMFIDTEDEEVREVLESFYYTQDDRLNNKKEIDPRKLMYEYYWIDYKQAAKKSNRYNYETKRYNGSVIKNGEAMEIASRSSFVIRDMVNVYPDTLAWIADFTYALNDPYTSMYFWHPSYDNYPVVGVTWKQARAFSIWRTNVMNKFLLSTEGATVHEYRLPLESEWEYAARGGIDLQLFPWGGPYTRNNEGCFLANFKPLRGNYVDDGGFNTVPVASYEPNDYGLYDMAGNVAEWTSNAFDESAFSFTHDMNPDYYYNAKPNDPPALKRKVIRGGSWKDIGMFLQNGTRTFEYQDTAKSYIGFRCVRSYQGGN